MTIAEYEKLDAMALSALIAKREVTASEVLEEAIVRAEKRNPALNAITIPLYDLARQVAKDSLPAGPLSGAPFLLKDLGASYKGTRSSGSSKLFADFVAPHDATIVARYHAAGLVTFGKTASPEMGLAPSTEPVMWGPCHNPWNLDHSSGGSSGGAAACGLFGVKPTRARNPSGPDVGEGWGGQSVGHCVSISVRDSAALLDVSHGPDVGDPYFAPAPAGKFVDEVGRDPGKLRIALCVDPWNGEPVDPECRKGTEDAAKLCESLGHSVTIARPEFDVTQFREATRILVAANVYASLSARAKALGKTLEKTDAEPMTWSLAELGIKYTAADYAGAITTIHRVGRVVARFFQQHDILLTPTMCSPPWPLGVLSLSTKDADSYLTAVNRSIAFTSLFNAAGNPAMSVPLHWSASGLPIGIQFVAPFGDEARLFRLAAQLEQAKPWKDKRPSMIGT